VSPDSEQLDREGRTSLHYASAQGDADQVDLLIRQGADVNGADRGGWTPLHFAAQATSSAAILRLVDAGAEVDPVDSHGNTPLWRATFASNGNGEAITALRARGADPCLKNLSGSSPLDLARLIANFDVAQYFADLL
jgi:uncharacterized protein